MARHNELRDGVADLAGKAYTTSHVHNNPLIYQGCVMKREKAKPDRPSGNTNTEDTPSEATE